MKKIILSLTVVMGLGLTQINAQDAKNVSFGVKAEANMSNFILKDLDGMKSKMNAGAAIGGFTKFDLGDHFALQPELLINYKNSKSEAGTYESNTEYWGAEIPVYALGQWSAGSGIFYAGVGPYVSCGFSSKSYPGGNDLYKKVNGETAMQRWDLGGGALVGYELANGIQINAGYKIGFLNMMDAGSDDHSMYNQTISLGVGFRF